MGKESVPITGRTQWDAVTELGRILGAPLLFFIILCAAVFGGVWLFQKQQSEQLREANKALTETYEKISGMQGRMIEGVNGLMGLHDNVTERLERKRTDMEKLETTAEEAETRARKAIEDVERSQQELVNIRTQKAEADASWQQVKDQIAALTKERDDLKVRLQSESATCARRIEEVRTRLADVATSLRDSGENFVAGIVEEIRAEQVDVKAAIDTFASAPSFDAAKNLEGQLLGVPIERVEEAVAGIADWATWFRLDEETLVGVLRHSELAFEWVIYLGFAEPLRRIEAHEAITAASVVNPSEPLTTHVMAMGFGPAGEVDSEGFPPGKTESQWRLRNILCELSDHCTLDLLSGTEVSLPVLSAEEFRERYTEKLGKLPAEHGLTRALAMTARKNKWDASKPDIRGLDNGNLDEVRVAFLGVVNAAVLGGELLDAEIRKTGLGREKFSRIAAAVLQPRFQVDGVMRSVRSNVAQYRAEGGLEDDNELVVSAIRSARYAKGGEQVEFVFHRDSGAGWLLKDFRSAGLIDPQYNTKD